MNSKITAPTYRGTVFNCMICGAFSAQFWSLLKTSSYGTSRLPLSVPHYSGDIPDIYAICWCKHCNGFSFWKDGNLIYPTTGSIETPNNDLPANVAKDYLEAANIASQSPRGAAALLRLAIQKLCDDLIEDDGDLNFKIGKLVEQGLNKKVQQALDVVRVVGNNAVHPGQIDLNDKPEVAQQLFVLINMIAQQMITEPAEVDAMFESLPEDAKKGIEQRDKK